ncbi:hypothetical protein [Planctellipticum variicoloris]|uniref:hypothetical protein n=1 Tax=Planctellipticum variicoloris TaxID=3064265 RepID=UPI003014045E|nr:hypothetical protein SH412_004846 [Planctomycetaceae bacterium SH412]
MAKPTSRTTVMDEVQIPLKPKIQVDHHSFDWNTLAESVADRIATTLQQDPTGCRYFNPAATVSCPSPWPEFFRLVRREQSRWCRRADNTIPRKVRRSPSRWISGGEWISNKYARYLDRALCFTGVLFIDGKLIQSHNWPKSEEPKSKRVSMDCPV